MLVSTAVSIVAGAAHEIQIRHRRNTFLDYANRHLFMPRGLYAMVLAFRDEEEGGPGHEDGPHARMLSKISRPPAGNLGIHQSAHNYIYRNPQQSTVQRALQSIRKTDGITHGEMQLPEAAELVHPHCDNPVKDTKLQDEQKRFLDEKENWDSILTVLAPPSQSASSSSPSNEPYSPSKDTCAPQLNEGCTGRKEKHQEAISAKRGQKDKNRVASKIKRALQEDALYLIIINLPEAQGFLDSVDRLDEVVERKKNDY
ncbi:hypothetical protein AAE478_005792 [Parahypoxylon ruwenzoriense]